MLNGKGLAGLAACAALACGGLVRAESAPSEMTLQPQYLADAAPPAPRKPLMDLFDKVGIAKTLDDLHLNIYGFVEGSYTYSASNPPGGIISGRVFDFEHEDPTFNQANITVERVVDVTKKEFDIGFRMEWTWGADSRLIHSNGLFDDQGVGNGPENQFDLTQAYVDLAIPVGNGLRVRAGKWVTLLGMETINPTTNALYSHSYMFGYAIPFTHTGVLGTYALNDAWTIDAGITRGWEQSLEDNNGSIDYIGRVTYTCPDKKTVVYLTGIAGPEATDDNGHWRGVVDLVVTYAATDAITLGFNGDFGFESNAAPDGEYATWYGVAGYAGYKLSSMFTVNGRAEWFADPDGARGLGTTGVYEGTLGLAITPFPDNNWGSNLKIRPEIRVDYAQEDIFDGGSQDYQVTAAIDAYFTF